MGRHLKNDYTNKNCGCWHVLKRDLNPASKSHETFWICECLNCGAIASVRKTDLDKNPSGCNNCKISWHKGDQYGLLTILGKGSQDGYVLVQCACGSDPFEVRISHLRGQNHSRTVSCGCFSKSSGEIKIQRFLEQYNYNFQSQYRVKDENNNIMVFDFVLFDNENHIIQCIEYDGEQHFKPIEFFGGELAFQHQQERDQRKEDWCKKNNIPLIRIPYYDFDKIDEQYLFARFPKLK